jgi:hypothetical protein
VLGRIPRWGLAQPKGSALSLLPHVAQEDSTVHYPADDGGSQGPLCPLDCNLSHFILVEPGPPGREDGLAELRLSLEKHISQQRTSYGGEARSHHPGNPPGDLGTWHWAAGREQGGWGRAFQARGPQHAWEPRPGYRGQGWRRGTSGQNHPGHQL